MNGFGAIILIVLCAISFYLGRHWEAMTIYHGLRDNGQVTSQWGESNKTRFTIIGTVK